MRREVEITANADGYERVVNRMGESLRNSFENARDAIDSASGNLEDVTQAMQNDMAAIEQSVSEVFGQILEKSYQYSENSKERLNFIRQEIQAGKTQLDIEQKKLEMAAKMRMEQEIMAARDAGDNVAEDEAKQRYREDIQDISSEYEIRKLQMSMMRERYEEQRREVDVEREDGGGDVNRQQTTGVDISQNVTSIRNAAVGAIGLTSLMSVAGFIGKTLMEGRQLDEARQKVAVLGVEGRNSGFGEPYGMKDAEFLEYQARVNQAAGSAKYDASGNLAFETRFSQQLGSLDQLTAILRTSDENDAQKAVLEMLSIFKNTKLFGVEKGDFTQLSEKIGFQTSMLQMQANQKEVTDSNINSRLIAGFATAGIDDQRLMSFVNPINQSITNPQNDFATAFLYRSLRKSNPDASLFDVKKMQEEGIYGEGTFSNLLGDLKDVYSGDALKMAISQMFGLKYWQSEKVANMDESQLNQITSRTDIDEMMSMGKGSAGTVSRLLSRLDNQLGGMGESALNTLQDFIDAYDNNGVDGLFAEMGQQIKEAIIQGFNEVKRSSTSYFTDPNESKGDASPFREDFEKSLITNPALNWLGALIKSIRIATEDNKTSEEKDKVFEEMNENLKQINEKTTKGNVVRENHVYTTEN